MNANCKALTVATAALLACSCFAASGESATINQRQHRQQVRIGQGVASGQLTPRETVRLERREAAIANREPRMRAAHGGHLTHRDRLVLDRRLNRLSTSIYLQKHDRQHR